MHANGFEDILEEFPPALENTKPLYRQIRGILPLLRQSGELDTGTHTPADELMLSYLMPKEMVSVSFQNTGLFSSRDEKAFDRNIQRQSVRHSVTLPTRLAKTG